MNSKQKLFTFGTLLGSLIVLGGCSSAEDNPVTPDKMNQIRQKESQDRGNFHPDTTTSPKAGG